MAKRRIINTRFWDDQYISKLDPEEKLLFLYILTNSNTEICGMYEINLKTIAVDTGIELNKVEVTLKKLQKDKKVFYFKGWLTAKNFIKYLERNIKINIGIKRSIEQVPAEVIQKFIELGHDAIGEFINQDEYKPDTRVKEIIDFFIKSLKHIRNTKENPIMNYGQVGKLLKDKLKNESQEDIEKIIVYYLVQPSWKKTEKGEWYNAGFKNTPVLSTMMTNSFYEKLKEDKKNDREFNKIVFKYTDSLKNINEDNKKEVDIIRDSIVKLFKRYD